MREKWSKMMAKLPHRAHRNRIRGQLRHAGLVHGPTAGTGRGAASAFGAGAAAAAVVAAAAAATCSTTASYPYSHQRRTAPLTAQRGRAPRAGPRATSASSVEQANRSANPTMLPYCAAESDALKVKNGRKNVKSAPYRPILSANRTRQRPTAVYAHADPAQNGQNGGN